MKRLYHINICPHTSIGIGYIVQAENESHGLAILSHNLRTGLKIIEAKIQAGDPNSRVYHQQDKDRFVEVLRTLRKPGRYAKDHNNFWGPKCWPKVTIKELRGAIAAAYINEVWLGKC